MGFVGGAVGSGEPVLMHYDGERFTQVDVPTNDRNATSLFKVWGIGSKLFAVGDVPEALAMGQRDMLDDALADQRDAVLE